MKVDYKVRDWVFQSWSQVQNNNWGLGLGLGLGGLIWDSGIGTWGGGGVVHILVFLRTPQRVKKKLKLV